MMLDGGGRLPEPMSPPEIAGEEFMSVQDPVRRAAGRPARVTRQAIAEAALRLGPDRATLTAIGRALGVDHSTLYRHVKNRDDLMRAAVDRALDGISWQRDAAEDWRAYLVRVSETVWDVYERHPGVAETIRMLEATPSSVIRAFAQICDGLCDAGFSSADAMLIVDSIMDMTNDSAVGWHRLAGASASGTTVAEAMRRTWEAEFASDEGREPVAALMAGVIASEPRLWWRRKLDLLLDGAAGLRPDGQ